MCFNNICVLNLLRCVSHLLGLWADEQGVSPTYSYGLQRIRVLAMFSSLVLMFMLSCWNFKVMLMAWIGVSTVDSPYNCWSVAYANQFLLNGIVLEHCLLITMM